jgi:hypothetical protein
MLSDMPAGTVRSPSAKTASLRLSFAGAAALLLAALAAGSAAAKFTPAWSYIPTAARVRLAAGSGGSLYLPARTPRFYRYRSGANLNDGVLAVQFRNRVRIRQGLWRWTKQSFVWQVRPISASTVCSEWARPQKTLQLAGNKVYWSTDADGGTAWRCVTDLHGRAHVLTASKGGTLPDVALAVVVASGLDVAHRG